MEVQYLFAGVALLIAVWLTGSQIVSSSRNRKARRSRETLRNKAADRTLAGRLFGETRATAQAKPSSVETPDGNEVDSGEQSVVEADAAVISMNRQAAELKVMRVTLQEKDLTIAQLQQVLDELTSTTATRESVNFLQKQLIASRAKVLQQEGELKQLRVDMGKRRPPVAGMSAASSHEPVSDPLSSLSTQTNEAMKAQLADQLTHAEAEAEDTQQNALELRRLRSELDSVREDRSSARTHIEELQIRIVEQQKALERAVEQRDSVGMGQNVKPLFATLEDKDDLKLIKGIGPVLEQRLNELGVTTLRQLAAFSEHDIDRVSTAIAAFPGRIEREDWVGKARELLSRKTQSV